MRGFASRQLLQPEWRLQCQAAAAGAGTLAPSACRVGWSATSPGTAVPSPVSPGVFYVSPRGVVDPPFI